MMIVIRETQTKEKPCLFYLPLFPIYFLMTSHMTYKEVRLILFTERTVGGRR